MKLSTILPCYCCYIVTCFTLTSALRCYYAISDSPKLPDTAKVVNCTDEANIKFCTKNYAEQHDNETAEVIFRQYTWSCASPYEQPLNLPCLHTTESGSAFINSERRWIINYARQCTCCSDLCNGDNIRRHCSEPPNLTKQCYAYPKLEGNGNFSSNAKVIKCSESTVCTKMINKKKGFTHINYSWGCMAIPTLQCSGQLKHSTNYYNELICGCCGSKCNDARMNNATMETCGPVSSASVNRPGVCDVTYLVFIILLSKLNV